jgi:SNF2 family DNA or RNA helicase
MWPLEAKFERRRFGRKMRGILSTPFQHQADCFNLSKDRRAFALFLDLGLGKSLVVLATAAHLYLEKKIKRLLILAPHGCYRNYDEIEVPRHLDPALPYKVAYWDSYQTKAVKEQLAKLEVPGEALRILVVNIEAVISDKVQDFLQAFMVKESTMMVVDESVTIANLSAKRTKIVINLAKFSEYRRICSGSPMPQSPMQLYSQTEFLQRNLLGFQNFFAFRNRFAVIKPMTFGRRTVQQIVGFRDLGALTNLMNKFSFIIKKADALDLPAKVYQVVDVKMGKKQEAAYDAMVKDAFISIDGARQVSAQLVITQILRLHQIACGFLKTDGGEEIPFDEPNDRLETLLDLLDQVEGKCIIWSTFRHNVRQIVAAISEKYGKETVVDYYGETSNDDKTTARISFQDLGSTVRFIVSNQATGSYGNTWTAAATVIYYSNSYSLNHREQSEDRAHRIGQQGAVHQLLEKDSNLLEEQKQEPSVLYIDLRARGTIDDKILRVLKAKKKLTDEIVVSNWRWLISREAA